MPYATLDGAAIAYTEAGDGAPLVFCHEFAGSMESWEGQVSYFARRYRTIAYNAKGYPPSAVPDDWRVYGYDRQVQVLLELLDHLGIAKAHICGLSMGAYTAVQFGLAHADRCLSITAAGVGTGSADPEFFLKESEERAALLDAQGMDGMEAYLSGSTRIRFREKDPVGWEKFRAGLAGHSAQGSAYTFRGVQMKRPTIYQLEEQLRQIEAPVLILVGDEDEPCLEPGLFMKRAMPRCGLAMFPQSGHTINLEEPALFNQTILDFLTSVEADRWPKRV